MKVKDFGIIGVSYASCGPTSSGGGLKVSGTRCCVSTHPLWLGSQLPRLLFYSALNKKSKLYKKRGFYTMKYSMYNRKRELSSQ
jgi:hypothetical protein